MVARGGLSHHLGTFEDSWRSSASFGASPFIYSLVNGCGSHRKQGLFMHQRGSWSKGGDGEAPQKLPTATEPGRSARALFGHVRTHLPLAGLSCNFGFLLLHMCLFAIIIPEIKIGCLVVWTLFFSFWSSEMYRRSTLVLTTFESKFGLHSCMDGTPWSALWTSYESVF
jgi:hypothetical protein